MDFQAPLEGCAWGSDALGIWALLGGVMETVAEITSLATFSLELHLQSTDWFTLFMFASVRRNDGKVTTYISSANTSSSLLRVHLWLLLQVSQPRGAIPPIPLSLSPVMCYFNQRAPLVSGVAGQGTEAQTLVSGPKLSLAGPLSRVAAGCLALHQWLPFSKTPCKKNHHFCWLQADCEPGTVPACSYHHYVE